MSAGLKPCRQSFATFATFATFASKLFSPVPAW